MVAVRIEPQAEHNAFAMMMAELLRQNIGAHLGKQKTLDHTRGKLVLIADDVPASATIVFGDGGIEVFDGVYGLPDITIRGQSEDLVRLSALESVTRWALPDPRGSNVRSIAQSLVRGKLRVHGALQHPALFLRISELMAV
jgi:hypothetical protein